MMGGVGGSHSEETARLVSGEKAPIISEGEGVRATYPTVVQRKRQKGEKETEGRDREKEEKT